MDAVTKKTLWYTAVIFIIVPNPVAVHTDMIMPAVNIAKRIMFITITINITLNKQQGTTPTCEVVPRSFFKDARMHAIWVCGSTPQNPDFFASLLFYLRL